MKYTRYDYRRKREERVSIIVILASIILAAVLLGTALSSLFIKNQAGKSKPQQNSSNSGQTAQKSDPGTAENAAPVRFLLVQGGVFQNKDYAATRKGKLKEVANPFSVEEDSGTRVFAGIFNEAEYDAVVKKVTEKGLPAAKVTYEINIEDQSCLEIAEIIKGHLKCLTPLTEQNAVAVGTENIKSWLPTLPKVDEKAKYYSLLEEYKTYINSLPAKIEKDKAEENYIYIYNILKKVGIKK